MLKNVVVAGHFAQHRKLIGVGHAIEHCKLLIDALQAHHLLAGLARGAHQLHIKRWRAGAERHAQGGEGGPRLHFLGQGRRYAVVAEMPGDAGEQRRADLLSEIASVSVKHRHAELVHGSAIEHHFHREQRTRGELLLDDVDHLHHPRFGDVHGAEHITLAGISARHAPQQALTMDDGGALEGRGALQRFALQFSALRCRQPAQRQQRDKWQAIKPRHCRRRDRVPDRE